MFVENGYLNEGLFKMNVMSVVSPTMNKIILLFTCLSLLMFGMNDYDIWILILCIDYQIWFFTKVWLGS